VTNMSHMFEGCKLLNNLDISQFKVGDETDTTSFFSGCSSLYFQTYKLYKIQKNPFCDIY